MKRKLSALLLAALLLVSLSMTALAADTPTYGAYNVKAESGYTLTPDGTADGSFYANASAFTLSCPAGTSAAGAGWSTSAASTACERAPTSRRTSRRSTASGCGCSTAAAAPSGGAADRPVKR